jgi:hypothetical protein
MRGDVTIKREFYGKRHLLPGVLPFVIGIFLYVAALTPMLPEIARVPIIIGLFVLTISTVIFMVNTAVRLQQTGIARWRLILSPTLLTVGTFLFHLLVGSTLARFITITITMLLLFGFILRMDTLKMTADATRESVLSYGQLISLVGIFFFGVFGFGIGQFVQIPTVIIAILLGVLIFTIAYELFLEIQIPFAQTRFLSAVAVGLIGAELFCALSFLPTPFMVNAIVLLIVFFFILRATARLLFNDPLGLRQLRPSLIFTLLLIVLVLTTAHWL